MPTTFRFRRLSLLALNVAPSLGATLAMLSVFLSLPAAAQDAPAGNPVWVTVLLGLAPWAVGLVIGLHLALKLGTWLHADAKKRTGFAAAFEEQAGIVADDVDAYVSKNGGSLKDLIDPAKRAAAEEALVADAKLEAKAAVDDALKRAL